MPSFFYLANLANNLSILLVFTKNLNFYSINFLTSFFPQHYLGLFCSSFSICNLNAKLIIFQIYFLISVFRTISFPWIWLQLCCCKYLYRMLSLLVTSVYFQISIDFLFNAVYYWICFPMILFCLPKVHDPFVEEKSVVGTKTQLAPSLWFIPSRIQAESPFLSGTAEWAMKLPFPGLLGAAESPVFSTG